MAELMPITQCSQYRQTLHMTPTHQNSPSFSRVSPKLLRSESLTFFHSSELKWKQTKKKKEQ